jgi:transposase
MNNQSDSFVIGVGLDTARYGHHVSFLRPDCQPAANPFTFTESPAGYDQLRKALEKLRENHESVHFQIRIDAAGLYAVNLERFLRSLPWPKTISVGQPKQNRDYRNVHFPKRKADAVDSHACARFAIVEHPPATPETPTAFVQLREIAGAVEGQAKHTTRLKNQLHNRLARVFPELALEASNLAAAWVLRLLAKYPTPAKIAAARLASLTAIPHVGEEKARKIQAVARQTVAALGGPVAEGLIRESVQAIEQSQKRKRALMRLLEQAYDDLPTGAHRRIETITGIGKQTAAALVAKMVDINRFATPGSVVNYFGIFPEEDSSGVDRFGRSVPSGAMRMSAKGNDLVRRCLWNAAKTAIVHNPAVRALYIRQRSAGKRGDVALGHCMRKLLHLVYAVWKTDRDFDADHASSARQSSGGKSAEGRKGESPERQAVTPAPLTITADSAANNPSDLGSGARREKRCKP